MHCKVTKNASKIKKKERKSSMKRTKKLASIILAMVMTLAMSATVFAQTQPLTPTDSDNASITINNPAKGETYSVYKLFDATVNENGEIAYQCTDNIPSEVAAFFSKDNSHNVIPADSILVKDENNKVTGTQMTTELKAALETWAKSATAVSTAKSDGSTLTFTGLPYGYYVVTTTHQSDAEEGEDAKSAITVTSTQPDASVYDKNVNEPSVTKTVEEKSYSIGDTVKYTATFDTTNYIKKDDAADEESKQVVDYLIKDTLPEYLSYVNVTKITIDGTEYKVDNATPQFNDKKEIRISWAEKNEDGSYTSRYAQGAKIVIEYQAVLTSTTNINAADTNTISITPYVDKGDGGEPKPWDETWEDTAEITTYAAAIKKVDQDGNSLAGAVFTIAGLTVEEVGDGVYRVVSYNPESDTQSAEMSTDGQGKLYIVGLAKDVTLTVTEFKAPDGYNKLTETMTLKPQVLEKTIYETSGERHYDSDGNLVSQSSTETTTKTVEKNLSDLDVGALKIENNKGTLLPSTGGIGTTIFYVVGGILVVGAAILLVTKKRMSREA